ncbi:hypothetical protein PLICRDRAFT_622163 [Plicaturopsis crispa FD-325 SS-3]|nr:hypothetical protein PLICRDRAFT_622163 [Plicaturopsis crispa FD-325 SS-3]
MADGGGSVSHMVPAGTPHASGDIDIPPPFVPSQNNTEPGAPSALGIDIHHQPHIQNQHMPDLSGTTASSPVTPVPVLVPMPARASAPNFLPDFPSHNTLGNSSFPLHSQTHSLHQGIHSQAASPPSNATSPSGAHTSYTSSLASALHPPSSATDSGYDDPGFMFPPAEYSMGNATGAGLAVDGLKEGSGSPETGGDAHLYIMGTMLTKFVLYTLS